VFLFWIGFFYLVLISGWLCEVIGFLFVLLGFVVIVFGVEIRCLSPPYVVALKEIGRRSAEWLFFITFCISLFLDLSQSFSLLLIV